jgi:hypothetical protein
MANQLLNYGFETENLQNDYNCPNCAEPITNPLCHDCLGKDILEWLSFYPDIKKKLSLKIKHYITEVNNSALHSLNCVSCNKKKAALCPYCFTEGIFNLLRSKKINVHVIGDFLSVFNFDLEKAGYLKDAEEDGLY